jgi:hypothetical protein
VKARVVVGVLVGAVALVVATALVVVEVLVESEFEEQ